MFYYYGAKHKLAKYYPEPQFDHVLEPFAGAAGYSCYWAERNPDLRFTLVEKDPRIIRAWAYLLSNVPLPKCPPVGTRTSNFLIMASATSNSIGTMKSLKVTNRVAKTYLGLAKRIERVRPFMQGRTRLVQGDYRLAPDDTGTWFIDPPYQLPRSQTSLTSSPRGMGYAPGCKSIDLSYLELADWVKSCHGQVIVCEQEGADWLPFRPFQEMQNSQGIFGKELVWTNE